MIDRTHKLPLVQQCRILELSRSIPMKRGFVYLFAVMDWASRRVLAWRLPNTLTADFCMETPKQKPA